MFLNLVTEANLYNVLNDRSCVVGSTIVMIAEPVNHDKSKSLFVTWFLYIPTLVKFYPNKITCILA